MSDIFDTKAIKPMLIKEAQQPFNSKDYIYEIKYDGIRCIGYCDTNSIDLRNKSNVTLIPRFPELNNVNQQIKEKCILDCELVVLQNGIPNFFEVQRRAIMSDSFKIRLAYTKSPASLIVYDILYYKNKDITNLPLIERKKILTDIVVENKSIIVSRYIEEFGIELYDLAVDKNLEGVVAKRKNSTYQFDKRSKDWIKFKKLIRDRFVICGYAKKNDKNPMNTLFLGQYNKDRLLYKGSVSFGVRLDFLYNYDCSVIPYSPFNMKIEDKANKESDIIWLEPKLVCEIESMPSTKSGLRQPVFKGIVDRKE